LNENRSEENKKSRMKRKEDKKKVKVGGRELGAHLKLKISSRCRAFSSYGY
jgi:hypothetical protein